jgi:hypothetical protein
MKTLATLIILFAASLLGGCAMTYTNKDRLEIFDTGEVRLYVLAGGINKDLSKTNCDEPSQSAAWKAYAQKEICPNLDKLQFVGGPFHTHPIRGIKAARAFAPITMNIEREDILEVSIVFAADGTESTPGRVERIVRKAKDTGPDCRWEGGKGATTAFMSGGVVCEGWDWKKQKFAK